MKQFVSIVWLLHNFYIKHLLLKYEYNVNYNYLTKIIIGTCAEGLSLCFTKKQNGAIYIEQNLNEGRHLTSFDFDTSSILCQKCEYIRTRTLTMTGNLLS